jgi:hypothetical protein
MLSLEANQADLMAITDSLRSVLNRIDHFGYVELGEIMSDWQTGDMHRKRPFTMRTRGRRSLRKVATTVRPHSRYEMQGEHRALLRAKRRHQLPHHWSTRPILRASLESSLFDKMTEAFHAAIRWGR